jgi:hypothetical protein
VFQGTYLNHCSQADPHSLYHGRPWAERLYFLQQQAKHLVDRSEEILQGHLHPVKEPLADGWPDPHCGWMALGVGPSPEISGDAVGVEDLQAMCLS